MSPFDTVLGDFPIIQEAMFGDLDDVLALHFFHSYLAADERVRAEDSELTGPPPPFDLVTITDERCRVESRFAKPDIPRLQQALGVPDRIVLPNGQHLPGIEALCILLRRLAYPNCLGDLVRIFRRSQATLSRTINFMLHTLHQRHSQLLHWDRECISASVMQAYAAAMRRKGRPLEHYIGFIDGTVCPLCRPSKYQCGFYNGHRCQHAIKF
jgi:hypothetical protein